METLVKRMCDKLGFDNKVLKDFCNVTDGINEKRRISLFLSEYSLHSEEKEYYKEIEKVLKLQYEDVITNMEKLFNEYAEADEVLKNED